MRRQIPWSLPLMPGLWLAASQIFELWPEVEELLEQEPRGDGVAAGELLDQGFGEWFARLGFDGGDEARADEAGEVVAGALAVALKEGVEVGDGAVVREQRTQGLQEGALAVGAYTVEQEQDLLVDVAGERVAHGFLEEGNQPLVAGHRPVQERFPPRAGCVGQIGHWRQPGEPVSAVVGPEGPRAQVEGAVGDVEKVGVAVEVLGRAG